MKEGRCSGNGFSLIIKTGMEKDQKFLEKAAQIFLENGAKTVSMDDLAREFGVSKKTLYLIYKNKDELLEDVLQHSTNKVLQVIKNLDEKIDNAIDRMFERDEEIERIASTNNSIMLKQLIKYYPDLFSKHMLLFSEKFAEIIAHNIERGRKQGYYREDFEAKLYAKMYFQLVMSYDSSPYIDTSTITKQEYHQEALKLYMNAITTEKGRQFMIENGH